MFDRYHVLYFTRRTPATYPRRSRRRFGPCRVRVRVNAVRSTTGVVDAKFETNLGGELAVGVANFKNRYNNVLQLPSNVDAAQAFATGSILYL
jgi:hypothetical protein